MKNENILNRLYGLGRELAELLGYTFVGFSVGRNFQSAFQLVGWQD